MKISASGTRPSEKETYVSGKRRLWVKGEPKSAGRANGKKGKPPDKWDWGNGAEL